MEKSNSNIDLIRSHVDTIILRSLLEEDKYGLEILNQISEKSKGLYALKQPTLYSCLKRLEKIGYITSYKGDTSNGAQRVYYSLLDEGRNFVMRDMEQWEFSRTIINHLLSDKEFDPSDKPPFQPEAFRPMTRRGLTKKNDEAESAEEEEIPTAPPVYFESKPLRSADSAPAMPAAVSESDFSVGHAEEYAPEEQETPFDYEAYERQIRALSEIYAPIESAPNTRSEAVEDDMVETEEEPVPYYPEKEKPVYAYEQNPVNYISSFSSIYDADPTEVQPKQESFVDYDFLSMSELKTKFKQEGFSVRPYVKKNTTDYYIGKYYFVNKLLLAAGLLFFLSFAIQLIAVHFTVGRAHQVGGGVFAAFLAVSALFPLTCLGAYAASPNRRSIAVFSLKNALLNISVVMINAFIVIFLVGYFGYHANVENIDSMIMPIIVPSLMLLNLPLDALIYYGLYQSKLFHIK